MDNQGGLIEKPLTITYSGIEIKKGAESLCDDLHEKFRVEINSPIETPRHIARLGAAEIIITIFLTSIVKTTLDAVLKYLEEYYTNQQEKSDKTVNIQIIIKRDKSDSGRRFPFRLSKAKPTLLKIVFNTIREFISRLEKEINKN